MYLIACNKTREPPHKPETRGFARQYVLLEKGEANLPKPSVVNVTQVLTVDKEMLVEWIGGLSDQRVQQVLEGLRLVTERRPW